MTLTIGYSPCPNDTFMFDALVHNKVDTEGIQFEPILADVEKLNQKTFRSELDVTKISYHALIHVLNDYSLLHSGSALGHNCGPLLISKRPIDIASIADNDIGIPGPFTTANFLLQYFLGRKAQARPMIFSDIESALLNEDIKAGVIIHENRFTYESKGLIKIRDLGEFWENQTRLPIPLGGIVAQRRLGQSTIQKIDRILRRSIEFAFANPESSRMYVKRHAQELDDSVIESHIRLYVNRFSINLGETGEEAIRFFIKTACELNSIQFPEAELFAH
ncbi:1,4-dihydroxy-6-naphthoate synthase [bacterium]|nr:1,4-dihydroxy-6-naphthoate synthase [bacterium]